MKTIPLNGKRGEGKYMIVDDDDYDFLSQFSWSYSRKGYAQAYIPVKWKHKYTCGKAIQAQRMILWDKLSNGLYADHINRNKLDNRKENLRVCNINESNRNRGPIYFKRRQDIVSKYKGVWWDKTRWRSAITVNNKKIYLGRFDDEDEAASAYNNAASFYFGEYANLNVIGACKQ